MGAQKYLIFSDNRGLGVVEIKLAGVLGRVSTPSPFYQMAALAAAPCIKWDFMEYSINACEGMAWT